MHILVEPAALVVLAGVPGAGKSTLIDRAVDRATADVLDTDDRRRAGRASRFKVVRVVGHYRRSTGAILLRRDRPVIVHSRGTSAAGRRLLLALAQVRGRPAHLLLLVAPTHEAIAGQVLRGRTVRPREMHRHARRFSRLVERRERVVRREGWASVRVLSRHDAAAVVRLGAASGAAPPRRQRRSSAALAASAASPGGASRR